MGGSGASAQNEEEEEKSERSRAGGTRGAAGSKRGSQTKTQEGWEQSRRRHGVRRIPAGTVWGRQLSTHLCGL